MRHAYPIATRSPGRPRGKWHLIANALSARTICDERVRGWGTIERSDLNPVDICARCLRDTP